MKSEDQLREAYKKQEEINVARDPWEHRSNSMRCKTCMWFVEKRPCAYSDPSIKYGSYDLGRCRRHAPCISGYPAVFVNDWCGDHKIDENRIQSV